MYDLKVFFVIEVNLYTLEYVFEICILAVLAQVRVCRSRNRRLFFPNTNIYEWLDF